MIHKIVANIYLFFQLYFEDWPLGGTNKRVQKEFHKLLLDVPTCRYTVTVLSCRKIRIGYKGTSNHKRKSSCGQPIVISLPHSVI